MATVPVTMVAHFKLINFIFKNAIETKVAMVCVAAVALGSSTYAWFVNNTQVQAKAVNVTATTAYSLQIRNSTETKFGTTTSIAKENAVKLTPTSTVGTATATAPAFFDSKDWNTDGKVVNFSEATGDEYYKDTVYLTAGQASKLYIDSTTTGLVDTAEEGLQTVNVNTFTTANNNLVKAMRVGMHVKKSDGTNVGFYVFQLDSGASDTTGGHAITTANVGVASANGLNGGVVSTTATEAFSNTKIKNYTTTIPTIASAAVEGSATSLVAGTSGTSLYDFTGANDICQIDIYIWMEGCDEECTAADSVEFATFAKAINFGFCVGNPSTGD